MRRLAALIVMAFAGLAAIAVQARPLVPAEQRQPPWQADMPLCDDPAVVGRIQRYFDRRESNYWGGHYSLVGIDHIRRTALRPWGLDYIPRRYCTGRAIISDARDRTLRKRTIHYNIIEDGGIIGATYGVEWCVVGLDRLRYFAPDCKMARP